MQVFSLRITFLLIVLNSYSFIAKLSVEKRDTHDSKKQVTTV